MFPSETFDEKPWELQGPESGREFPVNAREPNLTMLGYTWGEKEGLQRLLPVFGVLPRALLWLWLWALCLARVWKSPLRSVRVSHPRNFPGQHPEHATE